MRKLKLVRILLLLPLLTWPGWLMAQESAGEESAEKSKSESVSKDSEKSSKAESNTSSSDVFIPSEEISEDQSVPFPVDI